MNFSKLYDISVTLSANLVVWEGDPSVQIEKTGDMSQGSDCNTTRLTLGAHNGTHMDAPLHFIKDATGIDQMPLDSLIGTAHVLDMTALDHHIGAADLEKAAISADATRLLFKTRNSKIWATKGSQFQKDYLAVAPDGARWLVEHNIKLVGIDYLSIEQFAPPQHDTHTTLLAQRIVVVEGLDLSEIEPGEYTIFALPLKIKDGDGAPARVLLGRK